MIVVAIVAILAVVAAVGYRAIINSSKVAEPRQLLGSIRLAQESYKAETGSYADIGAGSLCPQAVASMAVPMTAKTGWNPACVGGGTTPLWSTLPVNPDGAVLFGYQTHAAVNIATLAPKTVQGVQIGGGQPAFAQGAVYWAYAEGNLGDGPIKLLTSSVSKEIFTDEP
jgi:type II secretory pathway pseudopilin PulG